jgi:hypothetical protein
MNTHPATALFERLTELSYAGRNPTWAEYEQGSPSERRAILSRWLEIQKGPLCDDWAAAVGRYGRALAKKPAEVEHESAQAMFLRGAETIGPDTSEDQGI